MSESLFISDVHLTSDCPEVIEQFLQFLAGRARTADALYILGDLFNVWIGDDDAADPNPRIIAALRALTNGGTKLYVQHGNRDFLLGRRFALATGCRLIKDPCRINLHGIPTMLMHGDLLCTDDVAYQRFRRFTYNPLFIWLFSLRSLTSRRRQAALYRKRSMEATAVKAGASMDVDQDTVETYMRRFKVLQLIHGHTHRPGLHQFSLDKVPCRRWVLADWHPEAASIICATPAGIRIEQLL